MYTIKENVVYELIIKNSRFITLLYKIDNYNDVLKMIDLVKKQYPGATHYCYAYICDDRKKSCDDGEPSGTAGMPILNVLENNKLNKVLAIVVRYFGGIKLGASGLIRAYSKCSSNALKNSNLLEMTLGYDVIINFPYEKIKEIDFLLRDMSIVKKDFNDMVCYRVLMPRNFIDTLDKLAINYEIIKEVYIEK